MKVLFVCLGNICRSPTAEGIFSALVQKEGLESVIHVDSAGTSAHHVGEMADSRMRKHASKRGYELKSISRQFVKSDFKTFDRILVMDQSNLRNVLALASNESDKEKVKLFSDYLKILDFDHVPDPYYGGAQGFETVIDIVEEASENLLKEIKNHIS